MIEILELRSFHWLLIEGQVRRQTLWAWFGTVSAGIPRLAFQFPGQLGHQLVETRDLDGPKVTADTLLQLQHVLVKGFASANTPVDATLVVVASAGTFF